MNCIINKMDSTHHPASKMSPSLTRMISIFDMADSFRVLHPKLKTFSHHYHTTQLGAGATRIDRSYSWGDMEVCEAKYEPVAFSDHMAYVVRFSLPKPLGWVKKQKVVKSFPASILCEGHIYKDFRNIIFHFV